MRPKCADYGPEWPDSLSDFARKRRKSRWLTDSPQWPLPKEVPLGYHELKLTGSDGLTSETHLIVCPDKAYLPAKLAQGGKTAGFNVRFTDYAPIAIGAAAISPICERWLNGLKENWGSVSSV